MYALMILKLFCKSTPTLLFPLPVRASQVFVWKTQTSPEERMAQPSYRWDSSVMEQQELEIMMSWKRLRVNRPRAICCCISPPSEAPTEITDFFIVHLGRIINPKHSIFYTSVSVTFFKNHF